MKSKEHSYLYEYKHKNDKYTFIGIDACIEPGPRRPFNFFGNLMEEDLKKLSQFSDLSRDSNGTIWFGHFPTSTIYSSSAVRSVMTYLLLQN